MGGRRNTIPRSTVGATVAVECRPQPWFQRLVLFASTLLAATLTTITLRAQPPIPELTAHVMDQAGILSDSARTKLEQQLSAYEKQTGHQFALLTIASLEGVPIEDYSIRVAERWKLGDEKRDDGLILVIAKQEKKMRIEVGYGLEGAVPDAIAARVIRHQLRPQFREGNFDAGVLQAFDTLMKAAQGEAVRIGPPKQEERGSGGVSLVPIAFWILIMLLVFARGGGGFLGGMMLGSMLGGRGGRGGGGGGGFGGGFSGGGGGFGGGGASGGW